MNPELEKMLQETLNLSRENNKMLKKMRSMQRWAQVRSIIYFILVIGSTVGAYLWIEPYIQKTVSAYSSTKSSVNNLFGGF